MSLSPGSALAVPTVVITHTRSPERIIAVETVHVCDAGIAAGVRATRTDGIFALPSLPATVGDDTSGPARLIEALGVVRNAKIGFGVGVALAVLVYAYRVAELGGPVATPPANATNAAATPGSPGLFLMLAFVLAVSAGALLTALLTVGAAIRLARDVE